MIKNFYSLRIVKDDITNRVNILLFAAKNRWDAEMFANLADLMNRQEIIKLHLLQGETNLRIMHFPINDLKGLLMDLNHLGFSIECPVLAQR